jgi:hypothetical protein
MIGLAQGAFTKAVSYAFQRKQFGKPIGEFQGMGFQFAEVATEIEAAKLLTYNAARRFVLSSSPYYPAERTAMSFCLDVIFTERRKAGHSRRRRRWRNTIALSLLRRPLVRQLSGQAALVSRGKLVSKSTGVTQKSYEAASEWACIDVTDRAFTTGRHIRGHI